MGWRGVWIERPVAGSHQVAAYESWGRALEMANQIKPKNNYRWEDAEDNQLEIIRFNDPYALMLTITHVDRNRQDFYMENVRQLDQFIATLEMLRVELYGKRE